jgi:hypothetical protein
MRGAQDSKIRQSDLRTTYLEQGATAYKMINLSSCSKAYTPISLIKLLG